MNGALAKLIASWPHSALSPNSRVHRIEKAKHTRFFRAEGWGLALTIPYACRMRIIEIPTPRVHLQFLPPNIRRRDEDNLEASCKALLDGLADGLKINDSRFKITRELLEQTTPGGCVKVFFLP